jgi:putative isomerase
MDRVQCKLMCVLKRFGLLLTAIAFAAPLHAQRKPVAASPRAHARSSVAAAAAAAEPVTSAEYKAVLQRLAQGWNTWDVHSVTTEVLLPEGLAIHVGMQHNTTEGGDAFLGDTLIGRLTPGAEQVFPGPHSWTGSYSDLKVSWKGHSWRVQSAHDGADLVLMATPLPAKPESALPPTIVFSVNFLWDRVGTALKQPGWIDTHGSSGNVRVFCTCEQADAARRPGLSKPDTDESRGLNIPVTGAYFAVDFTAPVAISTGRPRTLAEVEAILDGQHSAYEHSLSTVAGERPIIDAIQTTLGWDTIFEPEGRRVISPVSRVWSVGWGGYVIFDWDTFFAATMAGMGDRDLAYADAIETLRGVTAQGFVPNYARAGNWKSSDRSEPPVGSITVLGLYRQFGDRWFLKEAFPALLRWNQWWAKHRDMDGYLVWGSDGGNQPANLDDTTRGTRTGAILESGLDNSPMYDSAVYNAKTHQLEYADVGLMSMYIADCDALATIAETLHDDRDAHELSSRSDQYRRKLQTLWSPADGIFLNKDLHTGEFNHRLSPTNFYPMLASAATPKQAQSMIDRHLLNPHEFWGEWVIPSIERDDPAFKDQDYWRGRIWGPMNYLVYLGLRNYDDPEVRKQFARKSYALFAKEWLKNGHVHENYNAITGTGDDVTNSDRFYHWGALLGYIEYLQQTAPGTPGAVAAIDR